MILSFPTLTVAPSIDLVSQAQYVGSLNELANLYPNGQGASLADQLMVSLLNQLGYTSFVTAWLAVPRFYGTGG